MTGNILVLNAGSSSIKFSLYAAPDTAIDGTPLCMGAVDGIGHAARFHAAAGQGSVLIDTNLGEAKMHEAALSSLLQWLERRFTANHLRAAGHRVVHGGSHFTAPTLINGEVIARLRELVPLAPLHQPHHIAAIEALARLHRPYRRSPASTPPSTTSSRKSRRGLRCRLGCMMRACAAMAFTAYPMTISRACCRIMCAMKERKSIATTMGFTALDGLPMSRRCGALDPGVVLYLLNEKKIEANAVGDLLYNESGLLGVSGFSDDMRALLASKDPRAEEAIALFVYRIGRELGSLAAALGGLDALVFTAGIGEHAAEIRRRVLEDAAWLGVELDASANAAGGPRLSRPVSRVAAFVIPTDEDLMIARQSWDCLRSLAHLKLCEKSNGSNR